VLRTNTKLTPLQVMLRLTQNISTIATITAILPI
jgi:hypothetical protein